MIEYISEVNFPYVENVRDLIKKLKPALVVMDNFKRQINDKVNALLEQNDIHVCLLPTNTTDRTND